MSGSSWGITHRATGSKQMIPTRMGFRPGQPSCVGGSTFRWPGVEMLRFPAVRCPRCPGRSPRRDHWDWRDRISLLFGSPPPEYFCFLGREQACQQSRRAGARHLPFCSQGSKVAMICPSIECRCARASCLLPTTLPCTFPLRCATPRLLVDHHRLWRWRRRVHQWLWPTPDDLVDRGSEGVS